MHLFFRQRLDCELLEFLTEVGLGSEVVFIAATGFYRALHVRAVVEEDLGAHHVAELRTLGGDGVVVLHFDLLGVLHALRVGDHVFGELIDEAIAFE